jgi:DNA-binding response OmpR family regulator
MAGLILLVDDEADLQFMITSFFEAHGLQVLAAGDANEAMRRAEGASLSAIVLDVNLPGEGSGQLLEHLKRTHPAAPIILYTGRQGDDDTVKDLLAKGAARYLLKDGSLANLLAAVKEVCGD